MKIPQFVPRIGDLSETKRAILAFCDRPKTTEEVATYTGLSHDRVREHMRVLVRLDLVEKQHEEGKNPNHGITWQTTNKPLYWDAKHMTMRGRQRVLGVWI